MSGAIVPLSDVATRLETACRTYRAMIQEIEATRIEQAQHLSQHTAFAEEASSKLVVRFALLAHNPRTLPGLGRIESQISKA
jgi:hypothetical protein